MFLSKIVVRLFLLFTFYLGSSMLYADYIPIIEIEEVEAHVRSLRASGVDAKNIGIILDCHGVVTEEEGHSTSHKLKGKIREALTYFQEEGICVVIATAWDSLDDVIEHAIVATGLGHFFGVTPGKKTELEDFAVGPEGTVKLKGHKNGNVVALKNADDFADPTYLANYPYFRQKAFALEATYPGKIFTHIVGADDDTHNLLVFKKRDFPRTRHYSDECNLTLFHLQSSKSVLSLSNGVNFYPPPMQPLSTVPLSQPSSQPSSYQTPPLRTVIPYQVPTPPSNTFSRSKPSTQPSPLTTPHRVPTPPPSTFVPFILPSTPSTQPTSFRILPPPASIFNNHLLSLENIIFHPSAKFDPDSTPNQSPFISPSTTLTPLTTPYRVPTPPPSMTTGPYEQKPYSGNESPRGDNFDDEYGDNSDNK